MPTHTLTAGTIHEGDWMQADLQPGYTLAIVDGPYAMGKAAWDRMSVDGLADWYRPHLARVSALLAASASVYLWNTAEGWARLDPVMREAGWTFRSLIVWDKRTGPSVIANQKSDTFPAVMEVCGHYTRGAPDFRNDERSTGIWHLASTQYAGEKIRHPTEMLRAAHGIEWPAPLHVSQKPLAFAERMILASTRPGERVLVPFGGTCREAVICEWLARTRPEEARGYDVCELNADGVDYIGPVLEQIAGRPTTSIGAAQVRLFGAAK